MAAASQGQRRRRQEELVAVQTVVDEVRYLTILLGLALRTLHSYFACRMGSQLASTRLHLRLEDFAPKPVAESHMLAGEEVSLSSETLCRYLEKAEARTKAKLSGLQTPPRPGFRKRKLSSTPPEELSSLRMKQRSVCEKSIRQTKPKMTIHHT